MHNQEEDSDGEIANSETDVHDRHVMVGWLVGPCDRADANRPSLADTVSTRDV